MHMRTIVTFLLFCFVFFPLLHADDGMWLPHQMKELDLQKRGLQMNPADLFREDGSGLMSAVVSLGGGTGEFVSAEGLLLTNHHVAYNAVQRASSKEHDYLRDGFYAAARGDEIPAPGMICDVLLGYRDVTAEMEKAMAAAKTLLQRKLAEEAAGKRLVARAEAGGKDLVCSVRAMYSGNRYYLFTCKRLRDVRLVLAPPSTLGNFGGEVDNWMWPRHTCDFTMLRTYVSPTGVGAEYRPDNVPYRPKSWLKISLDGVRPGDFTFAMGYPGTTKRLAGTASLQLEIESMRRRIESAKGLIAFLETAGKDNRAVEIKYAGKVKGLYNGLKNRQAKLDGIARYDIVGRKAAVERELVEWIGKDPARRARYDDILNKLAAALQAEDLFARRREFIDNLTKSASAPTLLTQAYTIYRTALEKRKPDMQRESGYQERDWADIRVKVELAERSYDAAVDREQLKYTLRQGLALQEELRPAALRNVLGDVSGRTMERFVDDLYARTALTDPARRLAMLSLPLDKLLANRDPLILLAAELEKEQHSMRDKSKELEQQARDSEKMFQAGLLEMTGNGLAPDANGTIRFMCGTVEGYRPRDGVMNLPRTTLAGVVEKDSGQDPFQVPEALKTKWRARDFGRYGDAELQDVVTCFLNSACVTGGSSGSPILNARGEQVGLVFDMTYESVIGDFFYMPELQRTIHVDIRYVLWVVEKLTGAGRIVQELGLK